MPLQSSQLSNKFSSHLNYIDKTRKKADSLYSANKLSLRDIGIIYRGLFLDAATSFEKYLEDLFIGLLCNTVTHPSHRVKPKVNFRNTRVCRHVLRGERSYVDWLPYDKATDKRAKAYFSNGSPFCDLPKEHRRTLETIGYIRNALAHQSKYALKRFELEVTDGLILLPAEKTPVGFLRSTYTHLPFTTRYQYYDHELRGIANRLAK
jgi:hypothetical protein